MLNFFDRDRKNIFLNYLIQLKELYRGNSAISNIAAMDLSLLSLRYLNTGIQNNIYQRWVIKISQFHIREFSIYRFHRLRRSSCVYVIIIVICKYTFHVMFVVIAYE